MKLFASEYARIDAAMDSRAPPQNISFHSRAKHCCAFVQDRLLYCRSLDRVWAYIDQDDLILSRRGNFLRPLLMTWMAIFTLTGCAASFPAFDPGSRSATQFGIDEAACRFQASSADEWADQEAELFEDGTGEEIIGGALGAQLAAGRYERKIFTQCMESRGYQHD